MKNLTKFIPVIIVVVIISAACGNGSPIEIEGIEWILVSINGEPPIEGTNVTINFDNGGIGGNASCNTYFGDYTLEGDSISFGPLGSTLMYCEGLMDQETAFLAALGINTLVC